MAACVCVCRRRMVLFIHNSTKIPQRWNARQFCERKQEDFRKNVLPQILEPAIQTPFATSTGRSSKRVPLEVSIFPSPSPSSDLTGQKEQVSPVSSSTGQQPSELEIGKSVTVDARRVDPTTVKQVYYFDSLSFVKTLETKGFTREQAEGLVEALTEIINTTLDHQSRHMITKKQQEITIQQLMAEIVSVKKDMVLLQKSEFSQLRSETEKMGIELDNVKKSLVDEVNKLKGHVSLDINLERGRAVEAHANNAGKLQELRNKIDTDIANLKTVFEMYRNDVLKYAGGTVLTCATLCLGIIRLWH